MKQTIKQVCGVLLFALLSLSGFAQKTNGDKIIITGNVIDNTGLGLPGVNVIEKGTKNGVSTDIDGKYKIAVKKGATLLFAFIGMDRVEKAVGNQTVINVTLKEDATTLNEVIVVGYGKQKKGSLTSSVATIKPDDIRDLPVSNLSEALRGLTPGVSVSNANGSNRPGGAADITIRQSFGFTNATSSRVPLIVIDDMMQIDPTTGTPTQEAFNRLDPSEIESITVLKDGSAAIYGARASQGAIIVKTKRGKEGKAKLSYYSQFAINDAVSHQKTMSAYEHGVWKNRFLSSNLEADQSKYFSATELAQMKDLNYDWLKKAWKAATQQRHVLNVSGGTDKATYFAGVVFYTQGANLGEQDYKRWNFRTGTNVKVTDNLEFSASVSGTSTDTQKSFTKASANLNDSGSFGSLSSGEQADYMYLLHMPKYIPWQTTVSGREYWMSPFPRTDANLGSANNRGSIAGWNYFAALDAGKQTDEDFSYNVNLNLTYKVPFIKGMSIKGSYARTQSSSFTEQMQLPFDLARIKSYEFANQHLASAANPTIYNVNTNLNGGYDIDTNSAQSRVYYTSDLDKMIQSNIFVNYERTFGDHTIDAMAGVERSELNNRNVRLAYEGTGKDYLGDNATAGPISSNSTSTRAESGTLSYLGRLNYSFKNKYLLSLIFRSDASTKFAPENYWGFFPGAQVGWVVSKEKWFSENVSWVDNLKLRYSIGKTGKDAIQFWMWQQLYEPIVDKGAQFGSQGGTLGTGVTPRVTPNADVRWDTSLKQNYGIDLALLKNRLQITADYYFNKNTDMLVSLGSIVGTPISVGGALAERNYAAINNWGTEFSVNWNDKIKDKLSYNIGVNFGFNDDEIKKYPDSGFRLDSENARREGVSSYQPVWGFRTWKETSSGDGILRTDEDITNYWNYLTQKAKAVAGTPSYFNTTNVSMMRKGMLAYEDVGGVFNSNTGVQAPADGKIVANEDYVKLVNKNRTYGFTTNLGFKYNSFYFKTQIATSWGGYNAIDLVKQGIGSANNDWSHEIFWNDMYDATTNPNGKYPNMYQTANFNPSDFWQLNNFRCVVRNLSIGFEIPKEALKTIKVDGINLSITGQNLWDLYNPYPNKYRNMYDDSSAKYPTLRTWSLSMNVSF